MRDIRPAPFSSGMAHRQPRKAHIQAPPLKLTVERPSRSHLHVANIIIPSNNRNRPPFLAAVAVVGVDAIQRLEHDHGVAADHTHSQADFLVVGLALGGFVEDDVEEDVVATQRTHDFARAVELHFDALVEVLCFFLRLVI
jgi:hypothetical protein